MMKINIVKEKTFFVQPAFPFFPEIKRKSVKSGKVG